MALPVVCAGHGLLPFGLPVAVHERQPLLRAHLVSSMSHTWRLPRHHCGRAVLPPAQIRWRVYAIRDDAQADVLNSMEIFYHFQCRQLSAAGLSPVEFERADSQRLKSVEEYQGHPRGLPLNDSSSRITKDPTLSGLTRKFQC